MKRIPALVELSREHHGALKLARAAQAAAADSLPERQRLAARIRQLYASELDAHFRVEEQQLLPRLTQAGADALVRRTQAEHDALRALVAALEQADADLLARFGVLMQAHVRFEERELFEAFQELCSHEDD